jgi:alginate O-acetyltransferase complex protein AlgI
MLFNSIQFIFFFIIVVTLYFIVPHKYRWLLLLASSCYFYMAFIPVYILILGFTIIFDFFAGLILETTRGGKRKWIFIISIIVNIGILAFFKYYNFINENITTFLYGIGYKNPIPYLSILLPIGLSFHTFQALSYIIEVYRGAYKAERHFGIYALYVMFFPQLVAGPIERPQNLLYQFREKHVFNFERLSEGLKMMLWGFFKKIVIADRLALYVDPVYNNPHAHTGSSFILASIFFAFQIYCDFSGYSDIAIGSAHVLGFKLMQNFKLPYFSNSIAVFWQRWHVSLTSWLRDYVFFPVTFSISWKISGKSILGIKSEKVIYFIAISITWFLTGLWHGANWTFIIWGLIGGFYLVFARFTHKIRQKINSAIKLDKIPKAKYFLQTLITFALLCIIWIFFRAKDMETASYILSTIFTNPVSKLYLGVSQWITLLSICLIILLVLLEILQSYGCISIYFSKSKISRPFRWAGYIFMLIMICILGVGGTSFIYFQF